MPFSWWRLAFFVFTLGISYVTRTRLPEPQHATPAGFDEIDFPTATAGREIPQLYGQRILKGPNCVWFGDYKTTAIWR